MNEKFKEISLIILIPLFYAFIIFFIYDFNWNRMYDMMSLTFFITLPYGVGVLTILVSKIDKIKSIWYRLFSPWLVLSIFLFLTIVLAFEGWACWIMLFPFLAISSSIGGLTAGYFRLNKYKRQQKLNISLLFLIPLLFSPIESLISFPPSVFETNTEIIINAKDTEIWKNVTRVYKISKEEDKGFLTHLLGFPSPVNAELDSLAVDGYRKANFTKGLVFHETVTKYQDLKLMKFDIRANTFEIPSTTMDNHILIGGDYFDMIDGTYKLVRINDNTYVLKLQSHFKVITTFNWYSGFLGKMIMNDIQTNILKIVKSRSERQIVSKNL